MLVGGSMQVMEPPIFFTPGFFNLLQEDSEILL